MSEAGVPHLQGRSVQGAWGKEHEDCQETDFALFEFRSCARGECGKPAGLDE